MSNKIHKLEFLSTYGSDAHKAAIPAKIGHMVKNTNPEPDHNPYADGTDSLAVSHLVKGDHLHHLLNHKSESMRSMAAGNPNIKGEHLDHMVKHGTDSQIVQILHKKNPHLTSEHIHTILDREPEKGKYHPASTIGLSHSSKLDDSHWEKISKHSSTNLVQNAINSGRMPMKHLLHVAVYHKDAWASRSARDQHFDRYAKGEKGE